MIIKFVKKYWAQLLACIAALIMFFRSLPMFYTNDDFFFLKIAKVTSVGDFINFFNPIKDPEGIGVYRPLTLRVYYFLTVQFFHLSPLPLRIISFVTFFLIIFLVWKLAKMLTGSSKVAALSSLLYAVSVTHFGQLFYIGMFQELCLTALFLASIICFIKYAINAKKKYQFGKLVMSFILFVLAIMSKETAVVLPFVLILAFIYLKLVKKIKMSAKVIIYSLLPYFVVLGTYLFIHFRYFGLISGDSYVWDFSPAKALNTLTWYGLWSLNLPGMLLDFIGPGIHINPNLLKYWSNEIIPIFIFFVLQIFVILGLIIKLVRSDKKSNSKWYFVIFSILWFVGTLVPVLFLPIHKFSYYLTLPLVGMVFILSYLLADLKPRVYIPFLIIWITLSILSLHLTIETDWIVRGENVSQNVYSYFSQNRENFANKNIVFIDTPLDANLPWSPTATLKTVLSDQNFFEVFYPNLSTKVKYVGLTQIKKSSDTQVINSRQFLGY